MANIKIWSSPSQDFPQYKFGSLNAYLTSSSSTGLNYGLGIQGSGLGVTYYGSGFVPGTYQGNVTSIFERLSGETLYAIDGLDLPFSAIANYGGNHGGYQPLSGLGIYMGADTFNGIEGIEGRDVFRGMGGPDTLKGHGGSDTLYGGAGGDTLEGGSGSDLLIGGNGSDLIRGDYMHHVFFEGEDYGNDTIKAGAGADTLYGRDGSDVLIGGGGPNDIYAGNDNDVDTITVLTDGNFLGVEDHARFDDLYELGSNDRIIMDVSGPATLGFTSIGNDEINIWVDNELEAVVHGLSLSQVEDMTSFG